MSALQKLFVLIIGLASACFGSIATAADSASKADYVIGSDVSGTFYDPAQNGQGFVFQHIVSNGKPLLLAAWFTYLDGKQRWLFGVGAATGGQATIPLSISSGADFPPRFDPSAAQVEPWGSLTLNFTDASHGTATWTSSYPGFNGGSMPIERLTTPASSYDANVGQIAACHSGSWYDLAQSGHGIVTEVLGSGSQRQMVATWYVYLNGEQRWITAIGSVVGNSATLSATITSGANFPPSFNPASVVSEPWGTMTFASIDADHATWTWNSTQAGFGSGSLNLTRLSALSGSDCGPTSNKSAARFLTQASFGPTPTDVASVRSLGYAAWIDAQMAVPPTLQRPTIEQQIAAQVLIDPRNAQFYRVYRQERWFNSALYAPDQLRQRVAFALSQILVLSEVGALDNNTIGVAEYNDILLRNAFGNYRTLLRDVSLSPMMGTFLTHLRNQKTDWTVNDRGELQPGLIQPDENYAREAMQLFSIGLVERNRDFSPILSNGTPVPTYTQDLVTATARVLTGLSYSCSGPASVSGVIINRNCGTATGTAANFSSNLFFSTPGRYAAAGNVTALAHPDTYAPMVCYPRFSDTGRSATPANSYAILPAPNDSKTLLAGITVNPSPVACHASTPASDRQACLNYCNTQLDTLFDTLFLHPNVAPMMARQLIQRLTTSNPSPGYIERVAAVFEDDGSGTRGNLGAMVKAILLDAEARAPVPANDFGKLREPILRLTAILRAFGVQNGLNGSTGLSTAERGGLSQAPLRADSVFNFYAPDYQQPGEIADAGLFSPEFQILNESTFISMSDEFWRRILSGYNTSSPTTTSFATPGNTSYLAPTTIDAIPSAHAALVEELNQRMLYGAMSEVMRGKLVALLNNDMASADHRRKVLSLIHLIAISSEFAVQQ